MSTRSVIGFVDKDNGNEFRGCYHHWDGYPSGVGATLFGLWKLFFETSMSGSVDKMIEKIVRNHPKGWSTLNTFPPECFCHSRKEGEGELISLKEAARVGCEWAYVLSVNGIGEPVMSILASMTSDGKKGIGMFGSGDENWEWRFVTTVNLNYGEPDWKQIELSAV